MKQDKIKTVRYRLRTLCHLGRFTFMVRVKAKKPKTQPRPQGGFPKTLLGNILWELKHSG